MNEIISEQIEWIGSGKIGCVFASALVKQKEKVGWVFVVNPEKLIIPKDCFIYSAIFPEKNIEWVKNWAINNHANELQNIIDAILTFDKGLPFKWKGLTFQRGVNDSIFFNQVRIADNIAQQ